MAHRDPDSDSSLIVKLPNPPARPLTFTRSFTLTNTLTWRTNLQGGGRAACHVLGAVSALPATLYKFCIILAMNSSFCSKADRSKGGEGPEECWGRVRMYTESLKKLLELREGGW